MELPAEIWIYILIFLNDFKSLFNFGLTCKYNLILSNDEQLWHFICKKNKNYPIIKYVLSWKNSFILFQNEIIQSNRIDTYSPDLKDLTIFLKGDGKLYLSDGPNKIIDIFKLEKMNKFKNYIVFSFLQNHKKIKIYKYYILYPHIIILSDSIYKLSLYVHNIEGVCLKLYIENINIDISIDNEIKYEFITDIANFAILNNNTVLAWAEISCHLVGPIKIPVPSLEYYKITQDNLNYITVLHYPDGEIKIDNKELYYLLVNSYFPH